MFSPHQDHQQSYKRTNRRRKNTETFILGRNRYRSAVFSHMWPTAGWTAVHSSVSHVRTSNNRQRTPEKFTAKIVSERNMNKMSWWCFSDHEESERFTLVSTGCSVLSRNMADRCGHRKSDSQLKRKSNIKYLLRSNTSTTVSLPLPKITLIKYLHGILSPSVHEGARITGQGVNLR